MLFPFEILLTSDTLQPFHISSKTGRSFPNDKKIVFGLNYLSHKDPIYRISSLYVIWFGLHTDFEIKRGYIAKKKKLRKYLQYLKDG